MKYLTVTILLFLSLSQYAQSQNKYEDSLKLESAIEWLEEKLTYNYYNVEDDEWWTNRFTYNDGSKTITIKNIAASAPQAVTGKTYLELNFFLKDLNPYTILVEDRKANAGRLIKGKTIRVGAYDDRAVKRSRNGRRSSEQSFIYFSVPDFFEDSVQNFSQEIADRLIQAVELSTRLYPSQDYDADLKMMTNALYGRFRSDSTNTYWVIRNPLPSLYEILVLDKDLELIEKKYLKMPLSEKRFELTSIVPGNKTDIQHLKSDENNYLRFMNEESSFDFKTLNHFIFTHKGESFSFIRDWTFDPLKARYR